VLAPGEVTLCTQCAARRSIAADAVLPGIRIAGAAAFVAEVTADSAQALVY
jgi:predicted peroxiredoxin